MVNKLLVTDYGERATVVVDSDTHTYALYVLLHAKVY